MIVFNFRRFFTSIKKLIRSTFNNSTDFFQDYFFTLLATENQNIILLFTINKGKMINPNKGK